MGNTMMLSIIVPHFNSADLLEKLLSTIPDDPRIEVIVVDDHSTKKLAALADCKRKYEDRNIYFFENEIGKKSAGAARNTGIKHAKGRYLLFADADDWFLDGFWSAVQRNVVGGADVIYFAPTSQRISGREADRHVYYEGLVKDYLSDASYQNELKLRYLYWSPCSKLIKRSVVVKNNIFFDEIQYSNDMMFMARLGNVVNTIQASADVIYCILEHGGSLTTRKSESALMMRRKVYCRYYFYLWRRLCRSDFRLLGFTVQDDRRQMKRMMSVLWYEWQHGLIFSSAREMGKRRLK